MSTMHKNVVGPQVRKRRYNLGLKQDELAARLQVVGWEIDRAGVSKLESQLIWVSDFQMLYLGEALKIPPMELLPKLDPAKRLRRKHRQTPHEKTAGPRAPAPCSQSRAQDAATCVMTYRQ